MSGWERPGRSYAGMESHDVKKPKARMSRAEMHAEKAAAQDDRAQVAEEAAEVNQAGRLHVPGAASRGTRSGEWRCPEA